MQFLTKQLYKGVNNFLGNPVGGGNSNNDAQIRNKLSGCTYSDETKYVIQKAVKQVLHVYPFFNVEVLVFTEKHHQRRHIELRGILEIEIKGKTCKVDFNMMVPHDYPRSPPFVRIINRNPDYTVDPFYKSMQSNNDPSSFVLNSKLDTVHNWHPSNSLVNVIIECYDMLKTRFPFSKPQSTQSGGNQWDSMYNKNKNNNQGWGGNQGNQQGWAGNNNNNAGGWGGNNNNGGWGGNQGGGGWGGNNNGWVGQNNNAGGWGGNQGGGGAWENLPKGGMGGLIAGGGMGGMGGVSGSTNVNGTIVSAQKLVGTQKKHLDTLNGKYSQLLEKNQSLDILRRSLESESNYLRKQNYDMSTFVKENENSQNLDLTRIVQPKDALSDQILDLSSSLKAREDCLVYLQGKFNDEQLPFESFMKQLRRIEETRFEDKVLLEKCLKMAK